MTNLHCSRQWSFWYAIDFPTAIGCLFTQLSHLPFRTRDKHWRGCSWMGHPQSLGAWLCLNMGNQYNEIVANATMFNITPLATHSGSFKWLRQLLILLSIEALGVIVWFKKRIFYSVNWCFLHSGNLGDLLNIESWMHIFKNFNQRTIHLKEMKVHQRDFLLWFAGEITGTLVAIHFVISMKKWGAFRESFQSRKNRIFPRSDLKGDGFHVKWLKSRAL